MITALVWLGVIALVVAGLATLARERPMSDDEYEERRGKGAALGNALLALHDALEPGRREAVKAREERRAEVDPGADPPDPGPDEAGKRAVERPDGGRQDD